ncbi:MAG: trypsin-like peptidase domain-containing protein [Pirellulales bacterium]
MSEPLFDANSFDGNSFGPDDQVQSAPVSRPAPAAVPVQVVRESFISGRLQATLFLLTLAVVTPWFVERAQYAWTYGREKARVEVAREYLQHARLDELSQTFRRVSDSVAPSVVHIRTTAPASVGPEEHPFGSGAIYAMQGQGSGVIVDEAGYIVTNEHVIKSAEPQGPQPEIEVQLSDGRRERATVVGRDPLTDLAVLKISASKLVPAPWGASDDLAPGDFVWALGSPFGLDHSVTFGIVSAKGRRELVGSAYQDYLQTDVAVNPGNSGGPLIDVRGQVVGINTAIVGSAYQGVSFAIPSRVARKIYEQIKEHGSVERGWLGVSLADLSHEVARKLSLEPGSGVVLLDVKQNTPAAHAGLRNGDIVTSWAGTAVKSRIELMLAIADTPAESEVEVNLIRNKRPQTAKVLVGRRTLEQRK